MDSDLFTETIRLAQASDLSTAELARETGLKERWLYRLLRGDFQDPGVRKIEHLHKYLVAREGPEPQPTTARAGAAA
jgi:transcriptional regulator with XRE-family HTH domain